MTEEEINILTNESVRSIIRENLIVDPATFALSFKDNSVPVSLVSTQLKYLQKAKTKLPTYYNHLCIIPPLAYEQSSSEITARLKDYQGSKCLDLCMGLGVDSWHFSHHFDEVSSVEARGDLAQIGRYNFHLLSRPNIKVHHQTAEEFLADYQGPPFDLIYLDPARRNAQGQRVHDLEAGSPNIFELWPKLQQHGRRIVIKASPLYDMSQARKKIPALRKILIHSVKNEVRELILEAEPFENSSKVPQCEILIANGSEVSRFEFDESGDQPFRQTELISPTYLLEPDVAFYKGRKIAALFQHYFSALPGFLTHPMGFFLSDQMPEGYFPGRKFQIKETFPYKPKLLKKEFKQKGIQRANLIQRNFPLRIPDIRKQLSIKEGGNQYLLFTLWDQQMTVFLTDRIG